MKSAFFAVIGASVLLISCAGGREDPDGSACDPPCMGLLQCCGRGDGTASCVFPDNDPTNCGGCGIMCATGQRCVSGVCGGMLPDSGPIPPRIDGGPPGMCMPTCSSMQRCCGTTCVNRDVPTGTSGTADSSFMNCNGCGLACDSMRASACSRPAGGGAAPMCMCGNFAQCLAGEVCTMSGGSMRCVSLMSDPENCGMIGHACSGDEICRMGTCSCGSLGMSCAAGSTCCGSACIDTSADNSNCGGCGTTCGAGLTCSDSACRCGGVVCGPMDLCCPTTVPTPDAGPPPPGPDAGVPEGGTPSLPEGGSGGGGGVECRPPDAANCGGCGVVCEDGDMCVESTGFPPGTTPPTLCCGVAPFPGFAICTDMGGGFPDGGFPFP